LQSKHNFFIQMKQHEYSSETFPGINNAFSS
jgi:hypothetical protein